MLLTDDLTGQNFHGYIAEKKVYQGGFGERYKALYPDGSRYAAVKVIRENSAEDDTTLKERFLREIRMLQSVRHDNIIPILAFGYKNHHFYLVMPYIAGQDLGYLFNQKKFTPFDTWEFVRMISAALQRGHEQKILHRDLKPENILVEKLTSGRYKYYLSDFGLAKRPGIDKTLTAAGKMIGTPQYLSPEYIKDDGRIDARSDIYSLAIIVYELLVGRLPFDMETHYQTILAHVKMPPPLPTQFNPDFPKSLEAFLMRNLEKDRTERCQTMTQFSEAYYEAFSELSPKERQTSYWVE